MADVALVDLAGGFQLGEPAVLHRRAARLTAGRAGLTLLLLGLVFQVFDQLVERIDHAVLDALDRLARAAQGEPAADVGHAARDVIERFVFQTRPGLAASSAASFW